MVAWSLQGGIYFHFSGGGSLVEAMEAMPNLTNCTMSLCLQKDSSNLFLLKLQVLNMDSLVMS